MNKNYLQFNDQLQLFKIQNFKLLSGRTITEGRLGCYVYGESLANPIIILHPALTGSARAAFYYAEKNKPQKTQGDGWWDSCIGKGKLLDTSKYTIICCDHFGGNGQSTGAEELWHLREEVSFADGIELISQVLNSIGITEVQAIVGGSIGGGQALHWLEQNHVNIKKIIDISGSNSKCSRSNEFFALQADFLEYRDSPEATMYRLKKNSTDILGKYFAFDYLFHFILKQLENLNSNAIKQEEAIKQRLSITRQIGFIRFVTPEFYENKYHLYRLEGLTHNESLKRLESWLLYQGEKFLERFSIKALSLLCRMDYMSAAPNPERIAKNIIERNTQLCAYTVLGDTLFSPKMNLKFYKKIKEFLPEDSKNLVQNYSINDELNGHDHFLSDKLLENTAIFKFWLSSNNSIIPPKELMSDFLSRTIV